MPDQPIPPLDVLQAQLRGALDQQLAAVKQHYDEEVAAARRDAAADAERQIAARLESVRVEWTKKLEADVTAARKEGERTGLEAAAAQAREQIQQAIAHARQQIEKVHALKQQEIEQAVSAARAQAQQQIEQAVAAARAEGQQQTEQAVAAARTDAHQQREQAIAAAKADAQQQIEQAVAAARTEAQQQIEQAVAAARAEGQQQTEQAVAAARTDAHQEREQAIAAAKADAQQQIEQAAAAARVEAQQQIEQAVAAAKADAQQQTEQAIAAAARDAQQQHEQAMAAVKAEAQQHAEQSIAAARADAQREAEHGIAAATAAGQQQAEQAIAAATAQAQQHADKAAAASKRASDLEAERHTLQQQLDDTRQRAEQDAAALRAQLGAELDAAKAAAGAGGYGASASSTLAGLPPDRLVTALQHIDSAGSLSQALDALLRHAASVAGRAAIFSISGDRLKAWKGAAIPDSDVQAVDAPIDGRDLLARAVQSGQVTRSGAALPSPPFARLAPDRASAAVPLLVGGRPVAVLYADNGGAQPRAFDVWAPAIEIFARHTSAVLGLITATRTLELMNGGNGASHEDGDEQAARRYARLLVSEIKLYNEGAVRVGRQQRDLLQRLRAEIDRARQLYEERIPAGVGARGVYFQQELVQTLADGDPSLLGNA